MKTYKTELLVAAPLALLLYFVVLPEKGEFLRFGELLQAYVVPVLLVTGGVAVAHMVYARQAGFSAAKVERLANLWFWISAVLFAAILAIAVLYVKLSAVPAP
ncbi:hypothetical protein C0075_13080 [Rhizobium sp. KAs_5_22]|uniref:hypothetical protein n=1 Tax=Ciceribacter selenitireducens TaxID=448181 RepID=UPI00048BABE1|nr:hypothetical protein [Ciceribacter selenitireducens]PPJ46587.1 hypothetical protein C0075_13080 [Rhizobium sp. KAs_5_22]